MIGQLKLRRQPTKGLGGLTVRQQGLSMADLRLAILGIGIAQDNLPGADKRLADMDTGADKMLANCGAD